MSISGNLLDVSIADVMQFVHLGGRTGTLVIESQGRRGEVCFHRGRIINAWLPDSKKLGDLLGEPLVSRVHRYVDQVCVGKRLDGDPGTSFEIWNSGKVMICLVGGD